MLSGIERDAPSPSAPRILLTFGQGDCSRPSLVRTFQLARSLGAAIDVLRVLPNPLRWLRWLPKSMLQALVKRQLQRSRETVRATRYQLAPVYEDEPRPGQVVVRSGSFIAEVAAHASRRDPALIVVSADQRRLGALATELALASMRRILVPRAASRRRTILAASDLATRGLPVIREATRLASPLRMELVSFHNVDPLSDPDAETGPEPARRRSLPERMERARESLSMSGTAAVRTGVDHAAAIVAEAQESQADLIVVGVKQRSRLERLIHGSVAAQVVERAPCSVLVAPIAATGGQY